MYPVHRDMSHLWIDMIGQTTRTVVHVYVCVCVRLLWVCVCGSVCVNGGVRVSHMIIGRTERCKCDWTVGGQSNRRTKKIV